MQKLYVCINFRPFSGQPSCAYRGSKTLMAFLKREVRERNLEVLVEESVCMGRCPLGPNVKISGGSFIHHADEPKLIELLDQLAAGAEGP